jgi:NHL repeat
MRRLNTDRQQALVPGRRRHARGPRLALALAALAFPLAVPACAQASTSYVQVGEIPGFGSPVGGVALDRSTGDVFAVDGGNAIVNKYDASGTLIASFGGPASGEGQLGQGYLSGPAGVAVDQASGDVYVADRVNNRIVKFDSSGAYMGQFNGSATPAGGFSALGSVAVDPTSGDVYVLDPGHGVVDKFDASGTPVSVFGTSGVLDGSATPASSFAFPIASSQAAAGVAVDSSGRLYVSDTEHGVVDEFSSTGEYRGQLGAGTLSAPSSLAVDAADNVFAVDSSSQSVAEFNSAGSQVAGFPANTSRTLRGMAVSGDGARLYVSALAPFFSELSAVVIFARVTLPDATTLAPPSVQQTTATLEGTVNPDGVQLTDCRFAYIDDSDFQANGYSGPGVKSAPCVPAAGSIPADHTAHGVFASLTGLAPNTVYDFRLLAANANGTGHSGDRAFRTPGPPAIDAGSATGITAIEAVLRGQVNPEGFDTSYHFEYGTTTAYGTDAPVPYADLGAGSSDQRASTPLSDLIPGTTYHFRLAAQSAQGSAKGPDNTFTTYPAPVVTSNCPNEAIRGEANSTALPDCRAYELVTPSQKDGNEIGLPKDEADAAVAVDGTHVQYATGTAGAFGDATSGITGRFLATRSAGGWTSTFVGLPTPPHPELQDLGTPVGASRDFSTIFYNTSAGLDPRDQNNSVDVYSRSADGSVSWISQNDALATAAVSSQFVGASADGSHALFQTRQPLTPGAQSLVAGNELYERVGKSTILVGVNTDGTLTSACGAIAGSAIALQGVQPNAISSDGSRVFFESPDPNGGGDPSCSPVQGGSRPVELYLRQGAVTTTEISLSQRTGSVGTPAPQGATYQGASSAGSRVFFTSPNLLTDDAVIQAGDPEALYVYDVGSGSLTFIASGSPLAAKGGRPMISDDGFHAYFVGSVPGAGPAGQNLYLWDHGQISYVSAAPAQSVSDENAPRDARMSLDGSALLFTAAQSLTSHDSHGHTEIYLYRAAKNSLVCVSCDPTNSLPPSDHSAPDLGGGSGIEDLLTAANQSVTTNGEQAFFDSPAPLVPQDTNTGANPSCLVILEQAPATGCDVYEYENGAVHLISGGTGRPSHLVGVSSDGSDVIFNTSDQLVPQDQDGGYGNLFDARINGGFKFTPPAPPCEGEACRPLAPGAPAEEMPVSLGYVGPVDQGSTGSAPRLGVTILHKTGSRSSLLLTVVIPTKGRLTISGGGLKRLSQAVARAGTYRISVSLTGDEKRLLRRVGTATLRAKLIFRPSGGGSFSATVSVAIGRR